MKRTYPFRRWLWEQVSSGKRQPEGRGKERRRKLHFEELESRTLLAVSWINPSGGNWETPANWSSGALPGAGDDVLISTVSAAVVTISQNESVRSLTTGSNDTLSISAVLVTVTGNSTLGGGLSITGGSLYVSGAGVSLTANGSTTISNATLLAQAGATLSLPNLTSYTVTDGRTHSLDATGAGSTLALVHLVGITLGTNSDLFIAVQAGGTVSLPAWTQLNAGSTSMVQLTCDGAGSVLDLSALTSLSAASGSSSVLLASNGGTVRDVNLTSLAGLNLDLYAGSTLSTSQITSYSYGSLFADGGAWTFDALASLTNADVTAVDGASLSLPNLTNCAVTDGAQHTLEATGQGSTLTLAKLTGVTVGTNSNSYLTIEAVGNSAVSLPALTQINTGPVALISNDPGSTLDVSALTSFTLASGSWHSLIQDAGTFRDGSLTSFAGVDLSLYSNSLLPISQITSYTGGNLTVSSGTFTLSALTDLDNSQVTVQGGAIVSLPALASYSVTASNNGSGGLLEATGTGSTLTLPNLTGLTVGTSTGLTVEAYSGGTVNVPTLTQINTGTVGLSSSGAGSVLDVSALTSFWLASGSSTHSSLRFTSGGTVHDNGLTSLDGVDLSTDGTLSLSHITRYTRGNLSVSGGTFTLGGLTNLDNSNVTVTSGATLSLPALASYVSNGTTFEVDNPGTMLDLSALTTLTQQGFWNVNAYSGGVVKLSSLTSLASTKGITINDTGNGTILDGNLTTLNGVTATLGGDPQVAASWTSFTGGTLTVAGGSYNLAGLTNVDRSSLYAQGGGNLALPELASYVSNGTTFQVYGTGSVLDVSALATLTQQGSWTVNAYNGGVVKLSGLTSLTSTKGITLNETGNSTIRDGNLTSLNGVTATLDGSDTQVAASWTSFTNGTLTIAGGSYNLAGLTNVDCSSLYTQSGTSLALPGLTSYVSNGTTFQVNSTGCVLDVSALVTLTQLGSWTVNAYNGGVIKLSGLTSLAGPQGITLNETGNSTILNGNLTSLNGVTATLDGSDTQVAASWTSFTNGSLTVAGGSYNLPGLTNVDRSSLYTQSGTSLALPGITSYVSNGTTFQAGGTGSVLDLSALTTLTQLGYWHVYATSGVVKLSGLTSLTSTKGITILDTGNSTILAGNLTTLNGVTATLGGDPQVAASWTSFTNGSLTVTGGSQGLPGLTNVDRSSLYVQSGSSLALPGLTSYVCNGTSFNVYSGGVLDVSALATLTQQGGWNVVVAGGGVLKLNSLTSLISTQGLSLSDTGNSTILDSHLTSLTGVSVTLDGSDAHVADSWVSVANCGLNIFPGVTLNLPVLTQGNILLNNGQRFNIQGTLVYLPPAGTAGATINVPQSQGLTVTLRSIGTLTATTFNVGQGTSVVLLGTYTGGTTFNVAQGASAVLSGGTYTGGTTLNVAQGASTVLSGGTYTGGTTFNVAQGASVDLTGGQSVTYGGTLTGSGNGTVRCSGGTLLLGLGGVTVNFPGSMFQWTGGVIDSSVGDLINLGTLNLAGSSPKYFYYDGVLDNFGTINQTGSSLTLGGDHTAVTTLKIEPGASYLVSSDSGITSAGLAAVSNAGTIRKTAGSGTSDLFVYGQLTNTGTVEADSGTLYLDATSIAQCAGNTLTGGTWNALGGATLKFPAATAITNNAANMALGGAGATITGIGNLSTNSGSFAVTNGAGFVTNGNFSNSGNLTLGGPLAVAGTYTQTSSGTLNIQVGGTPASGLFGRVTATQTAALAGTFQVALVGTFTPLAGSAYVVLSFAQSTGNFATSTGLSPYFTESLNPGSLVLMNGTGNPVDLAVTSATAPTAAPAGQNITVAWQASNQTSQTATGNWVDSVYLSPTPAITSNSLLLGMVQHSGGLAANGTYPGSLTTAVPALPPGYYYVVVQVDSHYQVPDENRANNTLVATTGQLLVSVPALTIGTPASGTFAAAGQDDYYQVTVPAGGTLHIALASTAASGGVALYVSQNTLPTLYSYQQAANTANQPTQTVTVPQVLTAGTYYVLAHSVSGAAATAGYTLTVTQTGLLAVTGLGASSGGNAGNMTVEIDGANFTPDVTASLTLGSQVVTASAVDFVSASQIFATFNLAGVATGSYALSVQQGIQSATAATPFQVTTASAGRFTLDLSVPAFVRSGRTCTIVITYTNPTSNDMVAPLLLVSATNSQGSLSTPDDPTFFTHSAEVLAVAPTGPAGILRPGQGGQLTLTLLSGDSANGDQIPIQVGQVKSGQTLDWAAQQASLKPASIPTAAWNVVFNNLLATIGTTSDSYNAALAQAATYLGSLGDTISQISDAGRLWSFLVTQADACLPAATPTSATDAALPTPGSLSLAVDRSFVSSIGGRQAPGIFGLGWVTSWQTSLSVDNSGNVTIDSGGATNYFPLQANGSYQDMAGEYGTLTNAGGVYTFTDTSGTQYVFLANALLNYQQDTNGNRITLGYNTQNQLVTLTYSNPADPSEPTEQLTLAYNTQGFVSQVDDGTGAAWTYSYDPAGHLLSVTGPATLTTSYTYDTGNNPETAHALLSIADPDGSQQNFTYDAATGRLTGNSQNNGAEAITYAYPGEAEVTATDAAGNRTTVWYNDLGLVSRIEDPRGGVTDHRYDANGNVIEATDAAGNSYQYTYDRNGDLTQIVNPLGQTIKMTNGSLSNLTSVTDAAGNTTRYGYDSAGNLLSIAYADGSRQSFTYDPLGNLSETVEQSGDPVSYQHNAQGLLAGETFADGSSQTDAYDAHGNLLTAQTYSSGGALSGTTTLTYNAADQLLSITYPNGQSLHFTYDPATGQRTRSVDQDGFTLNYAYDAQARLSELTDGSGNLIVLYTYDNLGWLQEKQNGNGTYTTYAYDADGNLTSIVSYAAGNAVNSSFTYTYDTLGRQTSMTDRPGNTTSYAYDAIGQLTSVTLPGGQTITYVYSAAGNRTEVINGGTPTGYTSNAGNEITQIGSTTYSYDPNGNLHTVTDSGGTTTYTFNDLNQLVSIAAADGTITTFQYSPLGYLVGQNVGGAQTNYLVDPTGPGNVGGAYNGSGSVIAKYAYGLGLVNQTGPNGTGYYEFDASGNTVGITGAGGTYLNRYSYLPFGETTTVSGGLPNPFTFVGQFGVMQIGANLSYMRARYYSPGTGQFLSLDPAGLAGGETNLRQYAENAPTTFIDPAGMDDTVPNGSHGGAPGPGWEKTVKQEFNMWVKKGTMEYDLYAANDRNIRQESHMISQYKYEVKRMKRASAKVDAALAEAKAAKAAKTMAKLAKFGGYLKYGGRLLGAAGTLFTVAEMTPPTIELIKNPPTFHPENLGNFILAVLGIRKSWDPNALLGPSGFGTPNFIQDTGTLPYTIEFENDGSASAQDVTVAEQLDPDLDWSTFQLGSFGWGSVNVYVPAGLTHYQTTVSYHNVDSSPLNVLVTLDFNVDTGVLTVTYLSLDPLTGQAPTGVFDGFLPPNDQTHVGEGYVQYTARPKAGLTTGAAIVQQASIVFDTNDPLATNTVTNTIDAAAPSSSVGTLPATETSASFTVAWSGADDPGGSGIASNDVYVSDNGGPFAPFLTGTTQTSVSFTTGQNKHTYAFYSVATDNVGLRQPTPSGAQATTNVVIPAAVTGRHVFYNDSSFDGNDPGASALDDGAIATDKQALTPGQTTSFANVTSYTCGLNGLMIDIQNLATAQLLAADFAFSVGNGSPVTWADFGVSPTIAAARAGAGDSGSDRVTLTWPDYDLFNEQPGMAAHNQWLRVTVKAGTDTGLAADDVFYFGNLVGFSGYNLGDPTILVDTVQEAINIALHTGGGAAGITSPYDVNRNGAANIQDAIFSVMNTPRSLNLWTAPNSLTLAPLTLGESAQAASSPPAPLFTATSATTIDLAPVAAALSTPKTLSSAATAAIVPTQALTVQAVVPPTAVATVAMVPVPVAIVPPAAAPAASTPVTRTVVLDGGQSGLGRSAVAGVCWPLPQPKLGPALVDQVFASTGISSGTATPLSLLPQGGESELRPNPAAIVPPLQPAQQALGLVPLVAARYRSFTGTAASLEDFSRLAADDQNGSWPGALGSSPDDNRMPAAALRLSWLGRLRSRLSCWLF